MGSTTCLGLQSQTTRLNERTTQDDTSDESERDFNPLRSCVPADLNLQCVKWSSIKHLQFKYPLVKRKHPIQIGLCPLPSPVLGTSLLVSCPPLSDMLKFSGWSQVGGQAVLGRQNILPTPWLTERHGYDPTCTRFRLDFVLFPRRY